MISTILFMCFGVFVLLPQLFISFVNHRDITEHNNHKHIPSSIIHISREERKNHRTYEPTEEFRSESED
jgi:hypothetical protein